MSADVLLIAHTYGLAHNRVRLELDVLADAGLTAEVICLRNRGEPSRERYRTARIHRLPIRRHRGARLPVYFFEYLGFFLLAAAQVTWLCIRGRPRAVIVHTLPDPLVFAALVPRLLGARVILNMRELTPELVRTRYGIGADHALVRMATWLEAASCRFADHVITVHDAAADLLESRGVPRSELTVIANVTDVPVVEVGERRQERSGQEPFTLLYHGTAGNEYDLVGAVEALSLLRDRGMGATDVRLRIVGDGPELARVRARAAELGVDAGVAIEAPVPFAQVPALIAQADAGLALMHETPYAHLGIPTKLLECIACGVSVLSTPGAAIRHYFGDEELWYVPFGDARALADAIERLVRDPAIARARARLASRSLQPLLPGVMKQRYRNIFGEIANRNEAVMPAGLPVDEPEL